MTKKDEQLTQLRTDLDQLEIKQLDTQNKLIAASKASAALETEKSRLQQEAATSLQQLQAINGQLETNYARLQTESAASIAALETALSDNKLALGKMRVELTSSTVTLKDTELDLQAAKLAFTQEEKNRMALEADTSKAAAVTASTVVDLERLIVTLRAQLSESEGRLTTCDQTLIHVSAERDRLQDALSQMNDALQAAKNEAEKLLIQQANDKAALQQANVELKNLMKANADFKSASEEIQNLKVTTSFIIVLCVCLISCCIFHSLYFVHCLLRRFPPSMPQESWKAKPKNLPSIDHLAEIKSPRCVHSSSPLWQITRQLRQKQSNWKLL